MRSDANVFIGSSSEALELAQMVQTALAHDCVPTVWTDSVFGLNDSTFQRLVEACREFDFAIFLLTPDDKIESRSTVRRGPRDNVLFEFGLFTGELGPERTFAIKSTEDDLKLMSDLSGITLSVLLTAPPSGDGAMDRARRSARIATAVNPIRDAIRTLGPRPKKWRSSSAPLSFGSTLHLPDLTDAAINLKETRNDFFVELTRRIFSGELVPGKLLYYSDAATKLWKDICALQAYKFYKLSCEQLDKVAGELVSEARKCTKQKEFDLVSLGVGDGAKDDTLLRALMTDGIIHYYPIDISESMLVDGIRKATASLHGTQRDRLKVKGVIGDITQLRRFESVYEYRPHHNLFSLLGNTLGNNDERELVDALNAALFPNDLVLIEANVAPPARVPDDPFVRDDLNMRHDFSPLASLGLEYVPEAMSYREKTGLSVLGAKTRSVMALCDGSMLPNADPALRREIKLSVVHHYDAVELEQSLSFRLRAKRIWKHEENGVALLLFQRKS